jgi:hypothetical protein
MLTNRALALAVVSRSCAKWSVRQKAALAASTSLRLPEESQ